MKETFCTSGRSADGMLLGVVLNMRPDLFKATVAGVPLVDVRTTMLDPTLPLTAAEWEVCISYLAFISFHVSLSLKKMFHYHIVTFYTSFS
jgi:hypothetical protein